MPNVDDDPIRRRMAALSDDELRRVVTVDADDWQPEAITAAREERERRNLKGLTPYRDPSDKRSGPLAPVPDRRRPDVSKGIPLGLVAILLVRVILYLLRH